MTTATSTGDRKASSTTRRHPKSAGGKYAKRPSRRVGARDEVPRRWVRGVMETSDALDLEPGVFQLQSPRAIARSLKRSADRSRRRKADPFRSAMSMLTFYVNRGGRKLNADRRRILEQAKDELRALYGR
jgi:Protein of unknown function (DUF3175)